MKNKYYNKVELKLDSSSTKAIAKMMDKKRGNFQFNSKPNSTAVSTNLTKQHGTVSPSNTNSGLLKTGINKKKINIPAIIKSSSMSSLLKNGQNTNQGSNGNQTLISSPIAYKFFYDYCTNMETKDEKSQIVRQSQLSRYNYLKLSNENIFSETRGQANSNYNTLSQVANNQMPASYNKMSNEEMKWKSKSEISSRVLDKTYAGSSTEKRSNSRK